NPARSGAVVALLGVATAFALSLLFANQAVKAKIEDLKSTGATTLSIMPAGAASGPGAIGGGEPLTSSMFDRVKGLERVADSGATLGGGGIRLSQRMDSGSSGPSTSFQAPESEIDLESPVEAGTLGRRN